VVGPHGDFLFKEGSGHDQIYIAFDTGFAPIKSLIEHAMALDETAPMHLYRIAKNKDDLYLHNLCRSWEDALDNFHYYPCIGDNPIDAIIKNNQMFDDCDIYIAGDSNQTETLQQRLIETGMPTEQIALSTPLHFA